MDGHPFDILPQDMPPTPLVQVGKNGSESMRFREGGRMQLTGGADRSTESIFRVALFASLALGCQPIRCAGIVPGVSMRVSAGDLILDDGGDVDRVMGQIWETIRLKFTEWLMARYKSAGLRISVTSNIQIEFGQDEEYLIRPGVKQIDVDYDAAFTASYTAKQARHPLVISEPRKDVSESAAPLTMLRRLIETAMQKTVQSDNMLYSRLPVPVRYRATGAIDAWRQVRQAAGASGEDLSRRLRLYPIPPLVENFPLYVKSWARQEISEIAGPDAVSHANRSLVWQAFSACEGALYEPTPALHRLLDAAYIADDVPVGLITLPARAVCIIPDPSWWGRQGGIEAIALFRHDLDSDSTPHPSISCVTWTHYGGSERNVRMDVLQMSLTDPDKTIKRMFDDGDQFESDATAAAKSREHWERVLDYVIKMLLYLTVRDAHIVHERAYTDAPRIFSGLGKRKRAERLAEIEHLYDRHIIGPAILDREAIASLPKDGDAHEVRGHWRRPHFRMQPHGTHSSLRKLVFIGPTLVRPDRLGL